MNSFKVGRDSITRAVSAHSDPRGIGIPARRLGEAARGLTQEGGPPALQFSVMRFRSTARSRYHPGQTRWLEKEIVFLRIGCAGWRRAAYRHFPREDPDFFDRHCLVGRKRGVISCHVDIGPKSTKGCARVKFRIGVIAAILLWLPLSAFGCGSQTDCIVGDRLYRISIPTDEDVGNKLPALVFAHGYRGTAAGVMRNRALLDWAERERVAVIALQSDGPGWDLPHGPRTFDSDGAAEEAYVEAALSDAVRSFPLDPDRIVMSGFSAGGMITWHMACERPDLFAGFIPIAGTYWLKPPEDCQTPVKSLIHIHGDNDTVVPFEGRPIGPTRQGSIFDAFALYRSIGRFEGMEEFQVEDLFCRSEHNSLNRTFQFCWYDGGHEFRVRHVDFAWRSLAESALD